MQILSHDDLIKIIDKLEKTIEDKPELIYHNFDTYNEGVLCKNKILKELNFYRFILYTCDEFNIGESYYGFAYDDILYFCDDDINKFDRLIECFIWLRVCMTMLQSDLNLDLKKEWEQWIKAEE